MYIYIYVDVSLFTSVDEMTCSTNGRNTRYNFCRTHYVLIKAFFIRDKTSYT